jgi:hypothetical protein
MLWVSTLTAKQDPGHPPPAMGRHHNQIVLSARRGVDDRPVRMLVLCVYDIAFNASRLCSIFHPIQPLRCDGAHPARVRFQRVRNHVRLDRQDVEGS